MEINSESIYGTRAWSVFGEGPTFEASNPIKDQGFNEGTKHSSRDIRFVQKDNYVYATIMGNPTDNSIAIESLGLGSGNFKGKIKSVELLGSGTVEFKSASEALTVILPQKRANEIALVLKVEFTQDLSISDLNLFIEEVKQTRDKASGNAGFNTGQFDPQKIEILSDIPSSG